MGPAGTAEVRNAALSTLARHPQAMTRTALGALLALPLLLAGCTPASAVDSLPAPILGTVVIRSGTLTAEHHTVPNTSVPVHPTLAPPLDRPGVPFRVLPHGSGDRSVRIAWVDSSTRECGEVPGIWRHETTMQIVVTVYRMPELDGSADPDCTQQGVIHVQSLPLTAPVGDRTVNAFNGIAPFGAF